MFVRNAILLDPLDFSPLPPRDLLLKDGVIISVKPSRGITPNGARPESRDGSLPRGVEEHPIPEKEEEFDARGMYCLPGFVNCHAHTAMTLFRGLAEDARPSDWFNKYIWVYEKNLTPEDVYLGTLLGSAEMLLSGTTTVFDHYFFMEEAFKAFVEAGIRADLSWAVFGFGDKWRETFEKAFDFTLTYRNKHPRVTTSLGPHSPYLCPDPFLREIASKAGEEDLRVHIHVSEEGTQVTTSLWERRLTPIEVLEQTGILGKKTLLAHAYHVTEKDLLILKEKDPLIAHCPLTYMRFGDATPMLARALRRKIKIGLGSDGAASNGTMNLLEAAKAAALLSKLAAGDAEAAPVRSLLPLLWQGGRLLLGSNYGKIQSGSPADLVFIDPRQPSLQPENNPAATLIYSNSGSIVDTVMVNGKIVVSQGKLLTLDLSALYREVNRRAAFLRKNAGGRPMQQYL